MAAYEGRPKPIMSRLGEEQDPVRAGARLMSAFPERYPPMTISREKSSVTRSAASDGGTTMTPDVICTC
jgi:hypothetical protein